MIHTRQGNTDTAVASKGWQGDKKYEEPKRAGVSKKKNRGGRAGAGVRTRDSDLVKKKHACSSASLRDSFSANGKVRFEKWGKL